MTCRNFGNNNGVGIGIGVGSATIVDLHGNGVAERVAEIKNPAREFSRLAHSFSESLPRSSSANFTWWRACFPGGRRPPNRLRLNQKGERRRFLADDMAGS